MPYLEIKLGPDTLLLRFVGRIDYVFGRLPRADVQLRDMKVSRLHTQFFIDSRGGCFVRDLGSSGGTFVGQQRLRRGVIAPLTDQTKIKIGDARITFYDAEPPVNAIQPPGRSDPRGVIRTNARERYFEVEATVLAVDKVDPETQSGPAEAPPEVNPADFTDEGAPPPPRKQPPRNAPPTPKKPDTGIVEAPWEKKESGRVQPAPRDEVVSLKGGRKPTGKVPPRMDSVEYDETGSLKAPGVPSPKPPADGISSPEQLEGDAPPAPQPAAEEPVPPAPVTDEASEPAPPPAEDDLDETGRTARSSAVDEGSGAFQPPPPIAGELPEETDSAPPKLGMPTVRLERPDIVDRQMMDEAEEEGESEGAPRIPTAKLDKEELDKRRNEAEEAEQKREAAPRIGMDEGEKPEIQKKEKPGYTDDLTDTQIAEYLGGSASGRFGDVDFGGGRRQEEEEDEGEVAFGAAAVNIDDAEDIDIDDELSDEASEAPAEEVAEEASVEPVDDEPEPSEEIDEASTQTAGDTTAIKEEPAEDEAPAEEAAEEAPEEAREEADEGVAEEDVPSFDRKKTPPPTTRKGATSDRTFKPRKTRKLMKRKTAKITDKKNPTPPPGGDKTSRVQDDAVRQGADTMFIPKPDSARLARAAEDAHTGKIDEDEKSADEKPTGKARKIDENLGEASVDDMGHGPGGDTVALPPAMMKKLHEELKARADDEEEAEKPATIGENPTVKKTEDEDDEEEEFVLDEDYAFFTPPPPTRQARAEQQEDDVIDANDFAAESENLPAEKKAGGKKNDDTIVE